MKGWRRGLRFSSRQRTIHGDRFDYRHCRRAGASSGARPSCRGTSGHRVDYRAVQTPLPTGLTGLTVCRAHYNKTMIEDLFRHNRLDAVFHLGRTGSFKESAGKRFDLNVVGSQRS